jgi:hypothetical protein
MAGALIHSRYGIERKKSRCPANTRQDRRPVNPNFVTDAHYSSPSAGHGQDHYRAPISRNTWCAQASRGRATTLFAIATTGGGGSFARGWMALAGRGSRAHCLQRSSPGAKHSRGLRFPQTLHLDQPATARISKQMGGVAQAYERESERAWLSSTRRSTSSSFSLYNPCGCRRSCSQAWIVESSKPHSFAALRWPMPSFFRWRICR